MACNGHTLQKPTLKFANRTLEGKGKSLRSSGPEELAMGGIN